MMRTTLFLVLTVGFAGSASGQAPSSSDPPSVAVGQDVCATCHEAIASQFNRSAHGVRGPAEGAVSGGCEACHGPGSRHAAGDTGAIRAFAALVPADANRACLGCHARDKAMEWTGSAHATNDVACTSCHRIHQSREVLARLTRVEGFATSHATAPAPRGSLGRAEPELCFGCHADVRGKFLAMSRHPIREGRMSCSSCHDVHGSSERLTRTHERVNDLCVSCHTSKQGPFVFEHAPVDESCLTCHDAHGSVANNLLKQNEPFLCLQCHEMHFHSARSSQAAPFFLPSGGSTNPSGVAGFQRGFNTKCTACHSRVHGSDLPSQGVSSGGKKLTR